MLPRQAQILDAIIESFIQTGIPVGSSFICEEYDFNVSPATVRNEMAALEHEGLIAQPHTSAGRVPTSRAYRMFVNQLEFSAPLAARVQKDLERARKNFYLERTKQKLYDLVGILATATEHVSFATLPDMERVFYVGLGHMLRQPEFATDPLKATRVVERLEQDLYQVLLTLDIKPEGTVYIGEENILPEFQSCSLLAIPYFYKGFQGVLGVLGSTRMDYAYNLAALRAVLTYLS